MSASTTTPSSQAPAPLPQSTRTASELLQGLLDLFRASKSADDFTMDAVSKALGVPMQRFDANSFGAAGSLNTEWGWSVEVYNNAVGNRPRLNLTFATDPSLGENANPGMTSICELDFEYFASQLEELGYRRKPYYAEHNRHMNDDFTKDDLRISVYPEGEASWPIEKISHKCVSIVLAY